MKVVKINVKARTSCCWLGIIFIGIGVVAGLIILSAIVSAISERTADVTCIPLKGSGKTPGLVAVSPDGLLVAAAIHDETRIWRIDSGQLINVLKTEPGSLACLEFSPDGQLLARGCPGYKPDNHLVQIWDMSSLSRVRTLNHRNTEDIAFSPDGSILASVSLETLILWRVNDGFPLRRLKTPGYGAYIVEFNRAGTQVVVSSWIEDRFELLLWNMEGQIVWQKALSDHQVKDLQFSPDDRVLNIVTEDGQLETRDTRDGSLLKRLQLPIRDFIRTSTFSPDGGLVAVSYNERDLDEIFRTSDQVLIASYGPGESNPLAFSPDAKVLVTEHYYDLQICPVPLAPA